MVTAVLLFLIVLFILGFVPIPYFPIHDIMLLNLLGKSISLYDLILFLIILWILDILPWPFRGLATVILVLWLLSFFGIIAISGFSNILVFALIIGMVAYIFQGVKS